MRKTISLLVSLVFIIGLSGLAVAIAPDDKYTRATLKGLRGVYVLVEALHPEAEQDGLTRDQLQRDVELQLRKAGIGVLTEEERFREPGMPWLYVNVNTLKSKDLGIYAVAITVSLKQKVCLERNPTINIPTETWSTSFVGVVREKIMKTSVRDKLRDIVDEFINAYLAVNSK